MAAKTNRAAKRAESNAKKEAFKASILAGNVPTATATNVESADTLYADAFAALTKGNRRRIVSWLRAEAAICLSANETDRANLLSELAAGIEQPVWKIERRKQPAGA